MLSSVGGNPIGLQGPRAFGLNGRQAKQNPFQGVQADRFMRPSVTFEGQSAEKTLRKTVMYSLMVLSGFLGGGLYKPANALGQTTGLKGRVQVVAEQSAPIQQGLEGWTQADIARYQRLSVQWRAAEKAPLGSANRNNLRAALQSDWSRLQADCRAGQTGAQKVLARMAQDHLYDELTQPGPHLIRFGYNAFDKNSGNKVELQWRALCGLVSHAARQDSAGRQALATRFYPALYKVMSENPDERILKWGNFAINILFPGLSEAQKTETVNRLSEAFLAEPPGSTKLFALKSLNSVRHHYDQPAFWADLLQTVHQRMAQEEGPKAEESRKYYMVFLGLVQDGEMAAVVEPHLSPQASSDFQQVMAWNLGRVKSPKGLALLTRMIEDPAYSSDAREMALYSLETYRPQYNTQVMRLLKACAEPQGDLQGRVPPQVRDAAQAMLEKVADQFLTEPDFYVKTWLKTPAEQKSYRTLRAQYVEGWDKLSLAQKNMVDSSLIPYRQHLPELIRGQGRHAIVSGTVTVSAHVKNLVGVRALDGRWWDDIQGVSSGNVAVTSTNSLPVGRGNTFSHEFWHHLHKLVLNQKPGMKAQIENLFRTGNPMDYYAAYNEYEYLAQGGEAYAARFKDHAILYALAFDDGFQSSDSNLRSRLKRIDPVLYAFIESLTCVDCQTVLDVGSQKPIQRVANE